MKANNNIAIAATNATVNFTGKNSGVEYTVNFVLDEFLTTATVHQLWAMAYVGASNLVARRSPKWSQKAKDGKILIDLGIVKELLDLEQNDDIKKVKGEAESLLKGISKGTLEWEDVEAAADMHVGRLARKGHKVELKIKSRDLDGLIAYLQSRNAAYEKAGIARVG